MFESKYSKILTIILIIVIVAILGLLVFLVYDYYQKNMLSKEAAEFIDNYQGDSENNDQDGEEGNRDVEDILNQVQDTTGSNSNSSAAKKPKYKGFDVVATSMEIPAINFKYPVLDKVTRQSIEVAVAVLYPNGENINQPGNTVIMGHNYRNGLFFSNNKRLKVGDKIHITDYRGKKVTYTIYNKFETTDTDTSFYQRDTNGKAEVTLSTCTDASNNVRLIILARED